VVCSLPAAQILQSDFLWRRHSDGALVAAVCGVFSGSMLANKHLQAPSCGKGGECQARMKRRGALRRLAECAQRERCLLLFCVGWRGWPGWGWELVRSATLLAPSEGGQGTGSHEGRSSAEVAARALAAGLLLDTCYS